MGKSIAKEISMAPHCIDTRYLAACPCHYLHTSSPAHGKTSIDEQKQVTSIELDNALTPISTGCVILTFVTSQFETHQVIIADGVTSEQDA